jgi:PAS domain S-box-containing protein
MKTNIKLIFTSIIVIFIIGFLFFFFTYQEHIRQNAVRQLEKHALIIANSLWRYEKEAPIAYLQLAAQSNNYNKIIVTDESNNEFVSVTGLQSSNTEDLMNKIGLLPVFQLKTDIIYNDAVIGKINVDWQNRAVYTYLYILFCLFLLLLGIWFFLGLLVANKTLEIRVVERTSALEESQERLQSILDNAEAIIYLKDLKGRYITVNKQFEKLFAIDRNTLGGKTDFDIFPENIAAIYQKNDKQVVAEDKAIQFEEVAPGADGIRYYLSVKFPLKNVNGEIYSACGISTDITKRKKAEEELRVSEEKYRLVADNAADVIWTRDMDLNLTYLSPSAERLTGYTVQESTDVPMFKKLTTSSIEKINHTFMEELNLEQKGDSDPSRSRSLELDMIHKNGSIVCVEVTMNFIRNDDGKAVGILGITRDITERKESENALKESEEKLTRLKKMESLGLLAGGVAHDLNNVLSGIVSYPELLLLKLPEDSKLRKPIKTIQESGYRAAAIVQDLLTVARGVANVKEPLNLNTIVKDYLHSPECKKLKQYHSEVMIKTNLDADLLNVNGSQVHISKAIMNLVSNASEALEHNGKIIISTLNRYIDRPIKSYNDIKTGEYAILSVSDDGPGISSEDLGSIFEPFYTKKVMGRSGTGLGLAVVWNTVQDHNGYIEVTSGEKGTTFELFFPITRDELKDEDLSRPIENYKGDGQLILVVDDIKTQREISCSILDTLGYKTKAVSSGEEAVEYVKEHNVNLLLLDMIMDPGIGGSETYKRIKKIRPNQKAIVVSGFAETDDVKAIRKLGASRFLKKPFTIEKIGLAVKEELNK